MADTNDVVQRALAKLEADRAAREAGAAPDIAPLATAPQTTMEPTPAAPSAEEEMQRAMDERFQQIGDVGAKAYDFLMGTPPTTSIQKELAPPSIREPAALPQIPADIARAQQLQQAGLPGLATVGVTEPVPPPAAPSLLLPEYQRPKLELTPEQQMIASLPSKDEVDKHTEDKTKQRREDNAKAAAEDQVTKMQRESEARMQKMQDEAKAEINKLDNQARVRSLGEILRGGSFGEKLGAALALGLGALGQGLTGAKTNPVFDFLNQQAEQQAQKDKLTLEQKEALRRQLFQQGELEVRKLEQASHNQYRKDQLKIEREKIAAESNKMLEKMLFDAMQKQKNSGKFSGYALSEEQLASLTPEERSSKVTLPNGKAVLADGRHNAEKFIDMQSAIGSALNSAKELEKYMVPSARIPYTEANVNAQGIIQKLVGQLRLPYTGPGVLTDTERADLKLAIGDPTKIFGWLGAEKGRLARLQQELKLQLQHEAKIRGIKEPVIDETFRLVGGKARTEDSLVQEYKKMNPDMPEEKIRQIITKFPSI